MQRLVGAPIRTSSRELLAPNQTTLSRGSVFHVPAAEVGEMWHARGRGVAEKKKKKKGMGKRKNDVPCASFRFESLCSYSSFSFPRHMFFSLSFPTRRPFFVLRFFWMTVATSFKLFFLRNTTALLFALRLFAWMNPCVQTFIAILILILIS